MDSLRLPDVPAWLWTRFHERSEPSSRTFAPVIERWRRARDLGAPPEGPDPEDHLLRGDALRTHEERMEPLTRVAEGTLERVAQFVAARGYLLLLADADGVVVATRGGGEFADEARRVRLIEGACWSEAARGTNAIGTTLAEATPTVVQGHAHYGRLFQNLVCYAAPIRGPDGTVLAVLDATSTLPRRDDAIALAVTTAAQALEEAMRQGAYASAGAAVTRALGHALDRIRGPVLLVEAPGRIARWNEAALTALDDVGRGAAVRDVVGIGWTELQAEAVRGTPGGREIVVPPRRGEPPRRFNVAVDPILGADGRTIALLAYLEPPAAPRSRRPPPVLPPAIGPDPFARLFIADPALDAASRFARRIAASPLPVMLLAETGAGKELFARAIHDASPRAAGPFVAVNCGSIAPQLLESELFGYAPGAFTGADRGGRAGYFEEASGGTLFLDEVAEMSLAMQAALLRVLEDGGYRRVGEASRRHADVRVITATCRDLARMVADGTFRQDLYFRLKGATVALPPLRDRRDRLPLARHLLGELAPRHGLADAPTLSPEVERWIDRQPWPGNVRELKSLLDVALVIAAGAPRIELEHLPPDTDPSPPAREPAPLTLDDLQEQTIRRVLADVSGNVSAAAARLGIARSTIYRALRRRP